MVCVAFTELKLSCCTFSSGVFSSSLIVLQFGVPWTPNTIVEMVANALRSPNPSNSYRSLYTALVDIYFQELVSLVSGRPYHAGTGVSSRATLTLHQAIASGGGCHGLDGCNIVFVINVLVVLMKFSIVA